MNATQALGATTPVTPVADAVLAPGLSEGPRPLFAQVLGQPPAADSESPEASEAQDAALAPWLMALDSQQAPALPFTQPFSRLLGAAARDASGDGSVARASAGEAADGADPTGTGDTERSLAAPGLGGLFTGRGAAATHAAGPSAATTTVLSPRTAAPTPAQGDGPPAATPTRAAAESAIARATPADAAALAPTARPTRESASPDAFATVFNANANSAGGGAAEPTVRLDPARTELWQRPLSQALGERVQWQSTQGIDQARIRLDPPALGRIEIVVRQEGAQLQVQLTASSPEVARQLQHMGEGLRQELGQRQGQSVQVQVQAHDGAGAQADARGQRQGQQAGEEATPGQALRGEHDAARHFSLA